MDSAKAKSRNVKLIRAKPEQTIAKTGKERIKEQASSIQIKSILT
jgi:hypothetical protein